MNVKHGYGLPQLQGDGYVILPISMSLIENKQTAEWCYKVLSSIENKLNRLSSDVIIIMYTSGIYYNSDEKAFDVHRRNLTKMVSHKNSLVSLIKQRREYVLGAFHFLSTDYIILNSGNFQKIFQQLLELLNQDDDFRNAVKEDIGDRSYTEYNARFILEEFILGHLIRQQQVSFPDSLIDTEEWRLIAYNGAPLHADAYQWKHDVLPKYDNDNPFHEAQYNTDAEQVELLHATPS